MSTSKLRNSLQGFARRHWWTLLVIPVGLLGGFLYWKYVGCVTGQCALKSNPYAMIGYGSVFGFLIGSAIDDQRKKKQAKSDAAR